MNNIYIYAYYLAVVVKFKRGKKGIGLYDVVVGFGTLDEEIDHNTGKNKREAHEDFGPRKYGFPER